MASYGISDVPIISGGNAASSGGIIGYGSGRSRNRIGDIVASPILDAQQTKTVINAGKASSMPLLLAYMNTNYPGQVLDVKLHAANEGYIYEVRFLANTVVLRTVFLDATTLKAK